MPRYYFNVHGETEAAADLIGRKLADDEAARAEAHAVAQEVARMKVEEPQWPRNPWVEVVDDDQRPVTVIPVADTLDGPDRVN